MLRQSLLAALIGGSCGAAAGYWTPGPSAAIEAPAEMVTPAARVGVVPADPSAPPPAFHSSGQPISRPGAPDVVSSDILRRARELAQRPDVTALVALREAVLRRAEETGLKDAPSTTRGIEAIDRYLFEARALRLKLDATALRKGTW